MFKTVLLKKFEQGLNQALAWDPKTFPKLKALHQKTLRMEITDTPLVLDIQFQETGLTLSKVQTEYETTQKSDTTVKGPLGAFLNLQLTKDPRQAAQKGFQIWGDLETGLQMQSLFLEFNFDWEEALSQISNDVIAHQLVRSFKKLSTVHQKIASSFTHSLSDYLQEEIKVTPRTEELEDFFQGVDNLRNDAERLEAKLNFFEIESQT